VRRYLLHLPLELLRTWSLNSQLSPAHRWPAHPSLPRQSCRWTSPIPHSFLLASLFRSRSHRSKPTDRIPSSPPILLTHSASTSPASSLSPQTPGLIKVASAAWSPVEAPVIPHGHASTSTSAKPKTVTPAVAPLAIPPQKPKSAHSQFVYAKQAV